MPPSLRDLGPGETAQVLDLWVAAWSATLPEVDFEARRQWFSDHLSTCVEARFRLCGAFATPGDNLAGFIVISPELRFLEQISVHPQHWGTGVAAALIGEAKRLSPEGIVLDVNQNNPRAVAFYGKHGFRRLRADRNPRSGRPTWWYVWGDAEPPRR